MNEKWAREWLFYRVWIEMVDILKELWNTRWIYGAKCNFRIIGKLYTNIHLFTWINILKPILIFMMGCLCRFLFVFIFSSISNPKKRKKNKKIQPTYISFFCSPTFFVFLTLFACVLLHFLYVFLLFLKILFYIYIYIYLYLLCTNLNTK